MGCDLDEAAIATFLPPAVLERVRRIQAADGCRLDLIAAKLGLISDADLARLYANQFGEPALTAAAFPATPVAADRLSASYFKHARLLPIEDREESCVIVMADPLDDQAAAAVAFALDKPDNVNLPPGMRAWELSWR